MRLESIVLAVGVLVATPTTAAAVEEDPNVQDDQEFASDEVSSDEAPAPEDDPNVPDDQEVDHYGGGVQFTQPVAAADGGACRGVTGYQTAYNRADMFLFRAAMHGHWCWRNGRVTSATYTKYGTTASWTNWNYEGVQWVVNGGCIGCKYRYQRAGYKFQACFVWYCIKDYPWISMTLRGDGTADYHRGWG